VQPIDHPVEPAVSDQKIIRIKCPSLSCQRVLAVPTSARGKLVRCSSCGMTIRIPAPKVKPIPETSKKRDEEAA
jgi:uncharacterized Zn finger protein